MATNYVAPATKIYILKGIPFDNTFTHTIYFPNINAQTNYFTSRRKVFDDAPIPFDDADCTYQRQDNLIKIAHNAEQIRDCNYLMYQNRGFGNKWFYAFITGVHHSNNTCTWVTFEIDPLQTFMFDINILPCMVEREHSATDNVGENIEPEPIVPHHYTFEEVPLSYETGEVAMTWKLQPVVGSMLDETGAVISETGKYYNQIYSGVFYSTGDAATSILNAAASDSSNDQKISRSIATAYMAPVDDFPPIPSSVPAGASTQETWKKDAFITKLLNGSPLGMYPANSVKNLKLYTSPYNDFIVSNCEGETRNYAYEMFNPGVTDTLCKFRLYGTSAGIPEIIAVPLLYKNIPENFDEKLSLSNYAQCAIANNNYGAWAAQTGTKMAIQTVTTAIVDAIAIAALVAGTGGAAAPFIAASAITGATGSLIGNAVTAGVESKTKSFVSGSSAGGTSAMISCGIRKIRFYRRFPVLEECKRIDDFFSMYGYAVNELKVPNTHSRPHWNYVKTKFANIIPKQGTNTGITNEHLVKIRDIFNGGITFWKNPTEVGNYNLDNRAGTTPPTDMFTITFIPNGGTGTMPNGTAYAGIPYIFPANGFTAPDGKQFKYWSTDISSVNYYPGQSLLITQDTTIAPIWEDIPGTSYIVKYSKGDGRLWANMPNGTAYVNTPYVLPQNDYFVPPIPKSPEYTTKVFDKWRVYDAETYSPGEAVNIISDVTITATWKTITPIERKDYFVNTAIRMLGRPYVGGGNGPLNFDCSGLIYYCLNMSDYYITDNTADGYSNNTHWITIVYEHDLEAGDMIFFWNSNHTRVQHCGIMVSSTEFIHASSTGTVKRTILADYHSLDFARGKRVSWNDAIPRVRSEDE